MEFKCFSTFEEERVDSVWKHRKLVLKTVENAYGIQKNPADTLGIGWEALLYVQEIGEMTCKEPRQNWRNSLDSYLLILVEEGAGTVTVGGNSCPARGGRGVFLDCHQPYLIAVMRTVENPLGTLERTGNATFIRGLSAAECFSCSRQQETGRTCASCLESITREEAPDYELYESECLTQLMTLLLTKTGNAAGMLRGKHSRNGNKFISIWKNTLQKNHTGGSGESVSV